MELEFKQTVSKKVILLILNKIHLYNKKKVILLILNKMQSNITSTNHLAYTAITGVIIFTVH